MRFSVLLPTREGGKPLEHSIGSVLDQDRHDFELVVADNANTDETGGVLSRHRQDPRLKVVRSDSVLSVTDNWNAALSAATGDYVLLLNDDDLLLPRYFERTDAVLREMDEPDCLTNAACYFIFPDAALGADTATSRFRDPAYPSERITSQRLVGIEERRAKVRRMFANFGLAHCFPSMQRTIVSRDAIGRLPRGLFNPPFPDIYALVALCLTARTWAVTPERLMITGASAGSFWHLHFRGDDGAGVRYLGNDEALGRLPGDATLNTMVANLQALKRDLPNELDGIEPNETLYVGRQVWRWTREALGRHITPRELWSRIRLLSSRDLARLAFVPFQGVSRREAAHSLAARARGEDMLASERFDAVRGPADLREFADWLTRRDQASTSR